MPALLDQPLAEQHRVCYRWRQRDHACRAERTLLNDGKDVTGSRPGGTSNTDLGMRVRLASLKSP
jgi:hypothetical protein